MTEPLKIEKSVLGGPLIVFDDHDGRQCEISECRSLSADTQLLYMNIEGGAFLTQDTVRALLPLLQRFAETGRIGGEE